MSKEVKYDEMKFEDLIDMLEETVKELENGTTDLDESISKYTEAMKIVKVCNDKLKNATDSVNKILTENGTLEDMEFAE